MIKTIHWLSAFAIAAILIGSVSIGTIAFADDDDDDKKKKKKLSAAVCPAENVQHWETISWSAVVVFEHPTLPSVDGGFMKAQADPNRVYSYNELAASTLNTLGYLNSGNPITASDVTGANKQAEPQIICAES